MTGSYHRKQCHNSQWDSRSSTLPIDPIGNPCYSNLQSVIVSIILDELRNKESTKLIPWVSYQHRRWNVQLKEEKREYASETKFHSETRVFSCGKYWYWKQNTQNEKVNSTLLLLTRSSDWMAGRIRYLRNVKVGKCSIGLWIKNDRVDIAPFVFDVVRCVRIWSTNVYEDEMNSATLHISFEWVCALFPLNYPLEVHLHEAKSMKHRCTSIG